MQSTIVTFAVRPSDLAYFDESANRWLIAPGRYTAYVGTSSSDLDGAATFVVGHGHRGRRR